MKVLKTIAFTLALQGSLAQADMPSTHGMLVFGKKTTYASHLPMFHQPHDYQAIFQIDVLPAPRARTNEEHATASAYEAAQNNLNDEQPYFSIEPARMDLTKVLDGTITTFKAKLYKGHFERGGQLLGNTRVTVNKILIGAKLDGEQEPGTIEKYLVFGDKDEAYAAHVILERPSFDAIVKLEIPENTGDDFELPAQLGMPKANPVTKEYTVPTEGTVLIQGRAHALKIESILYLEEAELE
jgi:hypothetical protein